MEGTMKIMLERPDSGHNPMGVTVGENDLFALREAMFEFQKYTDAGELVARDEDGKVIARMTFEWIE